MRLEAEASYAIIIGTLPICHRPASILFDTGSVYLYKCMPMLMDVSTLVGDPLVVDQVYQSRLVTLDRYDTWVDMIIINMLDFDVILGMD